MSVFSRRTPKPSTIWCRIVYFPRHWRECNLGCRRFVWLVVPLHHHKNSCHHEGCWILSFQSNSRQLIEKRSTSSSIEGNLGIPFVFKVNIVCDLSLKSRDMKSSSVAFMNDCGRRPSIEGSSCLARRRASCLTESRLILWLSNPFKVVIALPCLNQNVSSRSAS